MTKQTAKDTLIAYCSTLSEKNCKIAFQLLQERFEIHRKKHLLFNRAGVEATSPEGKVRLTPNQYKMLLEEYGELGFHRMCELLYDYIVHLEERAECELVARQRLKEYSKISHYYKMTKGWVAKRYEEENPTRGNSEPQEDTLNFEDVSNKTQAIKFIKSIPSHLRFDNQEITFLMFEYDIKQDELE